MIATIGRNEASVAPIPISPASAVVVAAVKSFSIDFS
jgi:hypothetical protein